MFSWEIENYLNNKNNILNEKEFIQLVDKINNPQIKDVKLSRNVFILFLYLSDKPRQDFAWSALGEGIGTVGHHVAYALCPTDRRGELGDEVGLDLCGVGVR